MRVLFTTWAWPSHFFPMVPMAWALRAAGHEVLMASQPELLPTMRASGLPSVAVGHDVDVAAAYRRARRLALAAPVPSPGRADYVWAADRLASEGSATGVAGPRAARMEHAHAAMRRLEAETLAIFGHLSQDHTARAPGPPLFGEVAAAMVDGLIELGEQWRPDLVVYDPVTYAAPRLADRLGVPAVRSLFGPDVTYFVNAASRAGLGVASIDPCPPSLQLGDHIAPARRIRTRYVPSNGVTAVPAGLGPAGGRPRICLTWGTSINRLFGDDAFLPPQVLAGCIQLAQQRDAELVLAITSGQRHLLPSLPPWVTVLESVPLDALLGTCTALIHQGGAGTTLTALRHGLPQLILTQIFDQAVNAYRLVACGAGLTHTVTELTEEQLIRDGHTLLDETSLRDAAVGLRQEMLDQSPPADTVDELLALAGRSGDQ